MSEIQYNTETKRGWRIILIDESGTDILYGYAQDKAEKHAKEVVRRFNAFEAGGIVEELRTATKMGLNAMRGLKDINQLNDGPIRNEKGLKAHIEQIEAALTKS